MVQPPGEDQPQQPPFDPAQSPYGQQPQYGQQQQSYGSSPYGGGTNYPPPQKQGNGFAIAGIILAILVPILGLIFSIIGLTRSKVRAGAGKALSISGIVVSVVVMGGAAAAIAVVGNSTAADPGCVSAESAAGQMNTTLSTDEAALSRDQNNASALQGDLQHFLNDLSSLQAKVTAAEGQAQHQSVKAQIAALSSDMGTFTSTLQAVAQGNASQVSQLEAAASKVQNDGNALDTTCSSL